MKFSFLFITSGTFLKRKFSFFKVSISLSLSSIPVCGAVLDQVGLLPERPGADRADEGLLGGVVPE